MLEIILIILAIIIAIIGLLGCLLPILPGPPLSFLAIIIIELTLDKPFSTTFMLVMGFLAAATILIDYVLPIWGIKKFRATKLGIYGSIIGMLFGMPLVPPFGIMFGLFIGTVIGELMAGKKNEQALRIGTISFLLSITTIFIKFVVSSVMAFFIIKEGLIYFF